MEGETDISYKRKRIFKTITNCYKDMDIVQVTNDMHCIVMYRDRESDLWIGFSQNGQWVFKENIKMYVLHNTKMFLYCAKIIELPYETIQRYIYNNYKDILEKENISIFDVFPFGEIVRFIFGNFSDDYWLDLAWLWYDCLDLTEQIHIADTLVSLENVKRISQRNRQRIKWELKKLKNR